MKMNGWAAIVLRFCAKPSERTQKIVLNDFRPDAGLKTALLHLRMPFIVPCTLWLVLFCPDGAAGAACVSTGRGLATASPRPCPSPLLHRGRFSPSQRLAAPPAATTPTNFGRRVEFAPETARR